MRSAKILQFPEIIGNHWKKSFCDLAIMHPIVTFVIIRHIANASIANITGMKNIAADQRQDRMQNFVKWITATNYNGNHPISRTTRPTTDGSISKSNI